MTRQAATPAELNAWSGGKFPGFMGIEILSVDEGRLMASMTIRPEFLAPNGYLHAGSVVTLADTACGYGTRAQLPDGATGFTTVELKTNFLGTAFEGVLECEATIVHQGRTTQVWDARVIDRNSGRTLALFRCTQLILYPRPER